MALSYTSMLLLIAKECRYDEPRKNDVGKICLLFLSKGVSFTAYGPICMLSCRQSCDSIPSIESTPPRMSLWPLRTGCDAG